LKRSCYFNFSLFNITKGTEDANSIAFIYSTNQPKSLALLLLLECTLI